MRQGDLQISNGGASGIVTAIQAVFGDRVEVRSRGGIEPLGIRHPHCHAPARLRCEQGIIRRIAETADGQSLIVRAFNRKDKPECSGEVRLTRTDGGGAGGESLAAVGKIGLGEQPTGDLVPQG
ncbi:hypothetical protein D9M69_687890 [compost metagenome]